MGVDNLKDESLLRFYEGVRSQVEADRAHKRKFTAGTSVRKYADELRAEMTRRRLQHQPIDWSGD